MCQTPKKRERPSEPDHYAVLDIVKTASPVDVKKALRTKVLMHHPDKTTGTHDEMIEVLWSYSSWILLEPD